MLNSGSSSLTPFPLPMVRQKASNNVIPALPPGVSDATPALAPGLSDALVALLSQHGLVVQSPSLSPPAASVPTPPSIPAPSPPPQVRNLSRANRGTGGVLAEKMRVSKEITASATKRKSLVEPDAEVQDSSTSEVVEGTSGRPTKRAKGTKVCALLRLSLNHC